MTAYSDEILSAYIDGEGEPSMRDEIDRALEADAALAARIEALRGPDALLRDAIVETLAAKPFELAAPQTETSPETSNVVAFRKRQIPRVNWPVWGAIAASIALMLFGGLGGYVSRGGNSGPFAAETDGSVVASNNLADALSRARGGVSEPVGGATLTVALSFRAGSGHPCRQFNLSGADAGVSGIACHQGETWRVVGLVAHGGRKAPFQTAAGPEETLSRVADQLGFSEAMDAAAERRAIQTGWK